MMANLKYKYYLQAKLGIPQESIRKPQLEIFKFRYFPRNQIRRLRYFYISIQFPVFRSRYRRYRSQNVWSLTQKCWFKNSPLPMFLSVSVANPQLGPFRSAVSPQIYFRIRMSGNESWSHQSKWLTAVIRIRIQVKKHKKFLQLIF